MTNNLQPPPGDEWHDPENIGDPGKGFRFLLKGEVWDRPKPLGMIWFTTFNGAWKSHCYGILKSVTYRVPEQIPFYWDAPDRKSIEIEERVIAKIRQRRDTGRAKYGTTMEREDLSFLEWVQHLQEELMDAAIYAEKIIRDHSAKDAKP